MAACSETYMIVPSPRHICAPRHINMYHDQSSELAEIYLRFSIPILILMTRSRYG
jgi:hypothetical protein